MAATPRILIIAGSDSGGGAGIQADIKTVTMLGGHAMTAITAITAQNTQGVQAVMPVPTDMVIEQMASAIEDIGVDAIKIGMLPNADVVRAVAATLVLAEQISARGAGVRRADAIPIVFDPVMVATSGSTLADKDTIATFARLMSIATVVTPNLPELATLGGTNAVLAHGCHLVIKGGHGMGEEIVDRLLSPDGRIVRELRGPRIDTTSTHGTGCSFASALACGLGAGMPIESAFERAVRFVRAALKAAPGFGQGHGPMGHHLGTAPFDAMQS